MTTTKKLGIWMDHASAHLIDLENKMRDKLITSEFTFETKVEALTRSENIMHNKEQQMDEAYYKEIAEEILKKEHVLLFGPTNAKNELKNYLEKDSHFKNIKIEVQSADKMSDNEKHAFVSKHFNN